MWPRRRVRELLRFLGWRPSVEQEVEEELAHHLELRIREYEASGMDRSAARAAALERFGDVEAVGRACRDIGHQRERAMRRAEWMHDVGQDVRYAFRGLRRQPGFTAVAIATLALGIGASTAIFGVVRGVLLRPLPFEDADRLVRLWISNPGIDIARERVSVPDYEEWRRQQRSFTSLAAYSELPTGLVLTDGDEPVRLTTTYVTEPFFRTLGVQPAIGRFPVADEYVPGGDRVVVLSHDFWRSRFGANPGVVGRPIRINDESFILVGVMEPGVRFPTDEVQAWASLSLVRESSIPRQRFVRWWDVVARLAPGVSRAEAQAEMTTITRRLAGEYPDFNAGWENAVMLPIREAIVGDVRASLLVLFGAVLMVVLIAGVNVTNLMLARGTTRGREFAIRAALGAARTRVARQVLTETLVLAFVAGAFGLALAWWGQGQLVRLSAAELPRAADVRIDGMVLAFAAGITLLTGLAAGLIPALRSSSGAVAGRLREGGRAGSAARGTLRLRDALITAEVALAIVLVVGAGLMVRSFTRLVNVEPGFDTAHTLVARFTLPMTRDSTRALYVRRKDQILESVAAVPGIVSVAEIKGAPLRGAGEWTTYIVPGEPAPRQGEEPRAEIYPVTPGYFRTMGIPLLAGRDLAPGDTAEGNVGIVVSETVARRHWTVEGAVGQSVQFGGAPVPIVGVVGDVRAGGLDAPPQPIVYLPRALMQRVVVSLVARTTGEPEAVIAAVRRAIRDVHPDLPITEIIPMRDAVSESVATPRLLTTLISMFGLLALVLAVIGLYGVVSFLVGQRTNEIGIRMALGARASQVVRLMLWRGMIPVLAGVAIGVPAALAFTRVLESLLFQISATDLATFIAIPSILLLAALAAALIPARRAAAVDPIGALRPE